MWFAVIILCLNTSCGVYESETGIVHWKYNIQLTKPISFSSKPECTHFVVTVENKMIDKYKSIETQGKCVLIKRS